MLEHAYQHVLKELQDCDRGGAFQAEGIQYKEGTEKSRAYLEMEPLSAQGRIEILDHPKQVRELKALERRARAGGKTVVDHPSGRHDDHANALTIAAALVLSRGQGMSLESIQAWGESQRMFWRPSPHKLY